MSIHATYRATYRDGAACVKVIHEPRHVRAELRASRLYASCGLARHVLPVARVPRVGIRTPWCDAPLLAAAPHGLRAVRGTREDVLWRLLLLPWLLGDYDRHAENYFVSPADGGRLIAYDHNFAGSAAVAWVRAGDGDGDDTRTKRALAEYAGVRAHHALPVALLADMAARVALLSLTADGATTRADLALRRRVRVVRCLCALAERRGVQVRDLEMVSAGEGAETAADEGV